MMQCSKQFLNYNSNSSFLLTATCKLHLYRLKKGRANIFIIIKVLIHTNDKKNIFPLTQFKK